MHDQLVGLVIIWESQWSNDSENDLYKSLNIRIQKSPTRGLEIVKA